MCRRLATCLALMAALAFVVDGALAAEHHLATAPASGHYHTHGHSHSHGLGDAVAHHAADVDTGGTEMGGADMAAHHPGSSQPSADIGTDCCSCTCFAAIVLPHLNAQAAPFVLLQNINAVHRRHGDGIVLDGLRRPPRPLSIA